MEADKIDLVCKPGLYLHLAQQYGYKVIDYYPPSYEPIFSLACSILCMHKNGNIPEFCQRCSQALLVQNLFKDPYMEQFVSPVRIDIQNQVFILLPAGKPQHKWKELPEVPFPEISHIKYMKSLKNKDFTEEQQFEIQNFYKYKMLPQSKQNKSFLQLRQKFKLPQQMDEQVEKFPYYVERYYPIPDVNWFYQHQQLFQYRLCINQETFLIALKGQAQILKQKLYKNWLILIALEKSYLQDVFVYVFELSGLQAYESESEKKSFNLINKMKISKEQYYDETPEEEYFLKYDYHIDVLYQSVFVTISEYASACTNKSKIIHIPNILSSQLSFEQVEKISGKVEKLYIYRQENSQNRGQWKVSLTDTITILQLRTNKVKASFPNSKNITHINHISFDEIKKCLQLVVILKRQGDINISYLGVAQISIYSEEPKITYKQVERPQKEFYYVGEMLIQKWYISLYVPGNKSYKLINLPFIQ